MSVPSSPHVSDHPPRPASPHLSRRRKRIAGGVALLASTALLATSGLSAYAEVPSGWREIAKDSFSRTSSSSWGSANVGGSYTVTKSASATAATSGSAGTVKLSAGQSLTATLKSVNAAEVDISDTATITSAGSSFDLLRGWSARVKSDGSRYSARVRVNATGTATLGVSRFNGTAGTWLSGINLPFKLNKGQALRGELQVTGSSPVTIRTRVWLVGSPAPSWQIQHSDSASNRVTGAGAVEVFDHVASGNAAVTVAHDDLSGGGNDSGTAPPAPNPAPNPAPPPAPAPSPSGRGSAAIGSASYPIPSGAIYVDAARGSTTGSGSSSSPLKTIAAGAAKAPSRGTVVVRAGTYHESVTVASNKTITIQNYPNEAVWLDGSVPVTNWTRSGSTWVASGWTKEFSSSMGTDAGTKARFIGANPMAADPDQVFVNGSALWQVGSAGAVTAGKFYVNDAANTLTIGTDPAGKDVRASDVAQALNLSGPGSVVQGIGIRRYANGYEVRGALRLGGSGGTVRNVVIQDVATVGLSLSNNNKVIDRVTIERAGQMGIGGHHPDNSSITNSIVSRNNTQQFKDAPESGGIKITAARTFTVKNVEANNNGLGSGIWFDQSCYNVNITNSTANGNGKHGIELEVSDKGIIANNVATNGGEDGIILFNSGNFKVFNNDVGGSSLFGIKLAQDERRQATLGSYSEARDSRVSGVDPTVPWITRNIQLSNNVFGNGGRFQIYALDGKTRRAVDTWGLTISGNLFNKRVSSSDPTMVAWGKGDNVSLERYETPAALAAAKNSGWQNAQITSSKPIASMASDKSAYAGSAVPIPSDVAAATGLASGARLLGAR